MAEIVINHAMNFGRAPIVPTHPVSWKKLPSYCHNTCGPHHSDQEGGIIPDAEFPDRVWDFHPHSFQLANEDVT